VEPIASCSSMAQAILPGAYYGFFWSSTDKARRIWNDKDDWSHAVVCWCCGAGGSECGSRDRCWYWRKRFGAAVRRPARRSRKKAVSSSVHQGPRSFLSPGAIFLFADDWKGDESRGDAGLGVWTGSELGEHQAVCAPPCWARTAIPHR